MKVETDVMEDLAKIIEIRTQEIKHWRNMIDKHADGDNQLKQFENLFGDTKEKFLRFKDLIMKNHETADILEAKLNKTLAERSKIINTLNSDIHNLKRSIEKQTEENERLERELKEDAERFHKLKHTSDHSHAFLNSSLTVSSGRFIQRLHNDH